MSFFPVINQSLLMTKKLFRFEVSWLGLIRIGHEQRRSARLPHNQEDLGLIPEPTYSAWASHSILFSVSPLRKKEKNSETVCHKQHPTVIDRLHQESNFGFPSGVDFGQINFDVTEADESGRWAYLVLNCHDYYCLVGEATIIRFCKLSGSFPIHLNLVWN